ncbi:tetraspanin-4-like [Crassostrea virginica]
MACCFCSFRRMKTIFIFFNTILWFAGPGLLGVSIWQYITLNSYDPILELSKFQIPAIIYITAGVTSTCNGVIGCLGGVNERKGAILTFLIFLLVIFGIEVYASVEFFKFYDEVPQYLNGRIKKFNHDYYSDPSCKRHLDNLQIEMKCCGSHNFTDWEYGKIPHSCFQRSSGSIYMNYTIYKNGCSEELENWTKENLLIIGWGGFSFSVFQVLGIVLSSCYYYTLSKEYG